MRFYTRFLSLIVAMPLLLAGSATWNPQPWLGDLAQIRTAIDRDYPNRDWLITEREVSLDKWFDRAADAISNGASDDDARRALDALIKRFNDGHLELEWPRPKTDAPSGSSSLLPPPPTSVAEFCAARGFDARQVSIGTAAAMRGYVSSLGGEFATGSVRVGRYQVGILRIGVFSPLGYPNLCIQAVASAKVAIDQPCNEACEDKLLKSAHNLMTRELMASVERLKRSGAQVLLIDLTRNGGGTDWAEAAARVVSPVPLKSAPVQVIRSPAWAARWRALASNLRSDGALALANKADALARGLEPCSQPACTRLAPAGFASGLLAQASPGDFAGKAWGPEVFGPSQFPYRERVWKGPLVVLVDAETWSAAEQVAALIQDNNAGVVMGERTGGAGCGHMYGNQSIVLSHSEAKLSIPNCARLRRDGSNEVGGIIPDVPTGVRWSDGPRIAGRITYEKFPEAIAKAKRLR
jgi:Peptidase family S41